VLIAFLTAVDLLLVYIDNATGPFVPFTVFYIALIYVCITRVDKNWAYVVALISALGRTYVASKAYPSSAYLAFSVWQFVTSASVLLLICYLLDITHRRTRVDNAAASTAGPGVDGGESGRRHPRNTRQTRMKFLLSGIGTAFVVLASLHGGAASDAYAVKVDLSHIAQRPGFTVPLAADQAALGKVVLLTIDDGPRNAGVDRKILDILKRHSAKAVWLVNCITFDSNANPRAGENLQTLLQIQHDGHLIGNHTYNHLNLQELAASDHARMIWEIEQCSSSIKSATGSRPKYFRAPFGAYTAEIIRSANDAGMLYMQWSLSYDSLFGFRHPAPGDRPPSENEIRLLSDSAGNGTIVLMHDDQRTADSLDSFLSNLERRGYEFVLPQSNPVINQQS
jgi:peptidoglycan/xylan/chitin deacetylase (PgdA/CDA1 family)